MSASLKSAIVSSASMSKGGGYSRISVVSEDWVIPLAAAVLLEVGATFPLQLLAASPKMTGENLSKLRPAGADVGSDSGSWRGLSS
jgi:NADPH:quinone reductase-like Zn-dependent oxidoreductase